MQKLLLATNNSKKKKELQEILSQYNFEIVTPKDLSIQLEPKEDGVTFQENAEKKAKAFSEISKLPALADDSGIVVPSLGGSPGVFSARYGSAELDDEGRAKYLLHELGNHWMREAYYVCVICVYYPDHTKKFTEGVCRGEITLDYDSEGKEGFGYDPIFYYPPMKERFSRVIAMEKHRVSHRGIALSKLTTMLGFNS